MQANLPMGGYLINNLGTPAASTDASTKGYTDTQDTATQTAAIGLAAPSGAVLAFARSTAPTGWLAADGSAVSRATYAALFTAIGTTFGAGDGSTTFNVPDLRGYFIRGVNTSGSGVDPLRTFGSTQADAYLNHTHGVTDPTHVHTMGSGNNFAAGAGFGVGGSGGSTNTTASSTGITINTSTTGGTETRPKNIALLYCIKT